VRRGVEGRFVVWCEYQDGQGRLVWSRDKDGLVRGRVEGRFVVWCKYQDGQGCLVWSRDKDVAGVRRRDEGIARAGGAFRPVDPA
jgi:hypothetical protein